jgi:hypothetical protein
MPNRAGLEKQRFTRRQEAIRGHDGLPSRSPERQIHADAASRGDDPTSHATAGVAQSLGRDCGDRSGALLPICRPAVFPSDWVAVRRSGVGGSGGGDLAVGQAADGGRSQAGGSAARAQTRRGVTRAPASPCPGGVDKKRAGIRIPAPSCQRRPPWLVSLCAGGGSWGACLRRTPSRHLGTDGQSAG